MPNEDTKSWIGSIWCKIKDLMGEPKSLPGSFVKNSKVNVEIKSGDDWVVASGYIVGSKLNPKNGEIQVNLVVHPNEMVDMKQLRLVEDRKMKEQRVLNLLMKDVLNSDEKNELNALLEGHEDIIVTRNN